MHHETDIVLAGVRLTTKLTLKASCSVNLVTNVIAMDSVLLSAASTTQNVEISSAVCLLTGTANKVKHRSLH